MAIREENLTFESLERMADGRIAMLLMRHLQIVSGDCMNRPNDKTKRKVTLEFTFKPHADPDDLSVCDRVDMEIECKSKIPTYRSKVFQTRPHKTGFIYNQDFPDDIQQQSLFSESDGDE